MIKVFPVIAPAYYPEGILKTVEDLESLANITGDTLLDSLTFGFVFTGLSPQEVIQITSSASLVVCSQPKFTLISGTVHEWCRVFEALLHDESLRISLCQVFFVLENTSARRILKKYNKIQQQDTSFLIR